MDGAKANDYARRMSMLTERTELRHVSESDIPWVVDLLARVAADTPALDDWRAQATVAIRAMIGEYHTVGYGDYLVVTRNTGERIGYAGFRSLEPTHAEANIAISLDVPYRGRGLGRELLIALRARAPELGIQVLHAFIRPENIRSIQLFSENGFRFEGLTQNENQLTFQHFSYRF